MNIPKQASNQTIDNLIAVVGCDGTGKSTLTHDLVRILSKERPTEWRYLGLISGESGEKIKELPLIGPWLERRLAKKSEKEQSMRNKTPVAWASVIMYGFSLWRKSNLKKVCALANSGTLVISDRYPQTEISGFHFDGPGIGIERAPSGLIHTLAEKEIALYQEMAHTLPRMIIRLDIDIETAYSRKPDHDYTELSDKIEVMQKLHYNGAHIVDIDARAPYNEVLEKALTAIHESFSASGVKTVQE